MASHQLLLLTVMCCCVAQINSVSCPFGFVKYGKSCYWFSTVVADFFEAMSVCRAFGGHMAKIASKAEDDFIRGHAMFNGNVPRYLIGGSNMIGRWTWLGEESEMSYSNWALNQPDETGHNEHCLEIIRELGMFQWNDIPCTRRYNFICQRNVVLNSEKM